MGVKRKSGRIIIEMSEGQYMHLLLELGLAAEHRSDLAYLLVALGIASTDDPQEPTSGCRLVIAEKK